MQNSPQRVSAKQTDSGQREGLDQALDELYARLRERARAEWLRHKDAKVNPADATVSVHISTGHQPVAASQPKSNGATGRFRPKPRTTRRRLIRAVE